MGIFDYSDKSSDYDISQNHQRYHPLHVALLLIYDLVQIRKILQISETLFSSNPPGMVSKPARVAQIKSICRATTETASEYWQC